MGGGGGVLLSRWGYRLRLLGALWALGALATQKVGRLGGSCRLSWDYVFSTFPFLGKFSIQRFFVGSTYVFDSSDDIPSILTKKQMGGWSKIPCVAPKMRKLKKLQLRHTLSDFDGKI